MKIDEIIWRPVTELAGHSNGTAFLWKHNHCIEVAELFGNLPNDTRIKVRVYSPGVRTLIKIVRKGKDTGVHFISP